ncbi:MAG: hypothetical protein QM604_03185 [Microbacterium sp.]
MSETGTGWPHGRITWILGTVVLFGVGVLVGALLGNIWLGLLLAFVVSIGWAIAYESWRGRNVGIYDRDDDGAQL